MIFVFNIGSASLRWALFDKKLKKISGDSVEYPDFSKLAMLIESAIRRNSHLIREDPIRVAHRVVHGGTKFSQPTRIDSKVLPELKKLNDLAPLHNPRALKVIELCREELSKAEHYACFDTSFFTNLPDYTKFYALPLDLARKHQILRYGFHGISHEYVAKKAAENLKRPLEELKLITAHLGSGASITAIEDGTPIDTSMGFTPLEGLMMATRSGNIDPSVPLFLEKQGYSIEKIENILNKESGLKGVSGFTSDMRNILKEVKKQSFRHSGPDPESGEQQKPDPASPTGMFEKSAGSKNQKSKELRAGLALQMYAYQVKKYIGAYTVALGGIDALILTGAIAEGAPLVREMITHGLENTLGNFEVLTIPTDEELAIAKKIQTFKGNKPGL